MQGRLAVDGTTGESAGACQGGDDAVCIHLADTAPVERVGDVQVAGGVHGHILGGGQLGESRLLAVSEAEDAAARHGGHGPVGVELANLAGIGVGEVEVAGGVHGEALGRSNDGAGGYAISRPAGRHPIARHHGQGAGGIHFEHAVQAGAGEVDASVAIGRDGARVADRDGRSQGRQVEPRATRVNRGCVLLRQG